MNFIHLDFPLISIWERFGQVMNSGVSLWFSALGYFHVPSLPLHFSSRVCFYFSLRKPQCFSRLGN